MAPGTEGGVTRHLPSGETMSIFDAAMRYEKDGIPAVVLGGKEYGSGSSRDWAAKGPKLLGMRAVIAESYERIHRSNLVGMGILPLQFATGESAASLGLTGEETYDVEGVAEALASGFGNASGRDLKVKAHRADGSVKDVHGPGADRYAAGNPLLPARGDPPVRAAAAPREEGVGLHLLDPPRAT